MRPVWTRVARIQVNVTLFVLARPQEGWYDPKMLSRSGWVACATLLAGALVACSSQDGKAGPLGPQPQSLQTAWAYTEVWRTPYPTPFGTAGIAGIPPRPSYPPHTRLAAAGGSGGAVPSAVSGPVWQNVSEADAALAAYAPWLPAGAQRLPVFFSRPYGSTSEHKEFPLSTCPATDRAVAVDDIESFYVEARRALLAAGFVIEFEDHRPHDSRFAEDLLRATGPSARAMLGAGRYDPAQWPAGRAIPVTRPYLLRILFTQRCGGR